MENLFIAATPTSPEIDFRFDAHRLAMRGESYPENAAAFYGPVNAQLDAYLQSCQGQEIVVDIALSYFNSSSTKMLFNLFEALNRAALAGNTVRLHWVYDDEDDTIQEFGEELRADFDAIEFIDQPIRS
ncbi:DUF1987 domain-containing protein [Orrella sp. JC864]|uniref:DUF1987 domain-containing protein n=1 Tax=Orrella sp. JC864 TaxID=3120298 RepID=UPI0012BD6E38